MHQPLVDYIKKARTAGMKDDQIRQELLKVNWKKEVVEEALKSSSGASNMKFNPGIIIFVVLGIVLIGAIAFGFWYADKTLNWGIISQKQVTNNLIMAKMSSQSPLPQQTIAQRPSNSPPPSSSPTTDIASWQTYKNDKYGFEIRYPKGYSIDGIGLGVAFVPEKNPVMKGQVVYPLFNLSVIDFKSDMAPCSNFDDCLRLGVEREISKSELIVDGKRAVRHHFFGKAPYAGSEIEQIIIDNGDNAIKLNGYYEYGEEGISIFNQIFSTFKFTK